MNVLILQNTSIINFLNIEKKIWNYLNYLYSYLKFLNFLVLIPFYANKIFLIFPKCSTISICYKVDRKSHSYNTILLLL